jgi:hypothetical protein
VAFDVRVEAERAADDLPRTVGHRLHKKNFPTPPR